MFIWMEKLLKKLLLISDFYECKTCIINLISLLLNGYSSNDNVLRKLFQKCENSYSNFGILRHLYKSFRRPEVSWKQIKKNKNVLVYINRVKGLTIKSIVQIDQDFVKLISYKVFIIYKPSKYSISVPSIGIYFIFILFPGMFLILYKTKM